MDRKADNSGQMTDEQLRAVFKATSSARVARAVAGAADPWGFFDDDRFGAAASPSASGYFDSEDGEDDDEDEDALAGFWGDGGVGAGDDDGDDGEPRRGGARKGGSGKAAAKKRPPSRLGGGAGGGGGQTNASRAAIPRTHHVLTTGSGGGSGGQQALIRRKVRGGGGLGASSSSSHELFTLRLPPPPMPLSWGRTVRQWEPTTCRVPKNCASTEEAVSEAAKQVQPFAADAPLVVAGTPVAPAHAGHLLASSDVAALAKQVVTSAIEASTGGSSKRVFQAVVVHPGWVVSPGKSRGEEEGTAPSSSSAAAAATAVHPAATEASLRSFASLDLHRLVPSGYAFVWCPKSAILTLTKQMYSWGFAYVENLTWVQLAPCSAIAADATPPATPPQDSPASSSSSSSSYPPPLVARSHETLMIYRRGAEDVELRHQRSPDVVFDAADAGGGGAKAGGASGCGVGFGMPAAVYATIETMLPRARGAVLELWCGGRAGKRAGWTRVVQCCE